MNSTAKNKTVEVATSGNEPTATYNAPAVDKALDVLEFLGDASQGVSLTGIAEALGRTKQELFRVLICLHERGYLVRDELQCYRLSTKLFELGSRHTSSQALIARAMPHMERMARQLGESCHLNIVVQNRMLVIARVECDADVMLTVRVGATFELHRRTSGLVGLSFLPAARRREYWNQSGETLIRIKRYESQLAAIRERGFAVEDSPLAFGVKDSAAPILGSGSMLLGVLCVSHVRRTDEPAERPDIIRTVVEFAHAISAEFSPPSPVTKQTES
jgi:DNA-binding IclR family transcriptional regulator